MASLMDKVNGDPALNRRGVCYSTEFKLVAGGYNLLFRIEDGRITRVQSNTADLPTNGFTLTGDRESWNKFRQKFPPPGYHDIFAMLEYGHLKLDGDAMPLLSNILYVKGVLDHWRTTGVDL
jgi:hypothetical protein